MPDKILSEFSLSANASNSTFSHPANLTSGLGSWVSMLAVDRQPDFSPREQGPSSSKNGPSREDLLHPQSTSVERRFFFFSVISMELCRMGVYKCCTICMAPYQKRAKMCSDKINSARKRNQG